MNNNKQSIDLLKIKEIKTIKSHSEWVNTILLLKDNRIASSSADSTIKIFNFSSSKCELSLQGHYSTVTFLSQLTNNNLLISSL